MRIPIIASLILIGPLHLGCRTGPVPEFAPIEVPPGLSLQQVELAIFSGILNKPPPPEFDVTTELSEEEFRTLLWQHYLSEAKGRSWFPESREPGLIRAAVDTRGHYLRVALTYDRSSIRTRIEESRELLQGEGRIHRRAIKWINSLHAHIRRELGRMSFARSPAAYQGASDERARLTR